MSLINKVFIWERKSNKVDKASLVIILRSLLNSISWLESIPALWLEISIIAICLGAIVLLAETLHRRAATTSEVARKIVHIGTGNVILVAWWLQLPGWVGISAAVIAGAIALLSYYIPVLPGINSVGRKSFGTFFYAMSMGILIAWFWPLEEFQYAAIGILVMTWGDGLAGLIGQNFGQHPYQIWGMKKSWEGSLTMTLVSYIVSSLILFGVQGNIWQTWVVSLAVALFATGLEAFSKLGIDNLTVPLGSGALVFYLSDILRGLS